MINVRSWDGWVIKLQFKCKGGFGKLPTYPSPKPTLSLTSHLGQNVGLGEG